MGMVKWTDEGFKLIGRLLTNETPLSKSGFKVMARNLQRVLLKA
jgi:hypothetical protein